MLKAKKRITKREIKQDKLVTTYFEARTALEENKRLISTLATLVVIIAVGIWFYLNNRAADNENALADLGKIMRYYDEGNFDRAINGVPEENVRGLQSIVEIYASTEGVELSKLYLANSYFALRQFEKALQHYEDADISNPALNASAIAGAGACYEAIGNPTDAALFFEKAAASDSQGILAPEYFLQAAHNYIAAGKKVKALELLKKIKKDYPTSGPARDIDREIAFANA